MELFAAGAILLGWIGILTLAVVFTVQTSRGNNLGIKALKFLGLLVSFVPCMGLVMYGVFRTRPSGYGNKCGVMAIVGLGWYIILQRLRAFVEGVSP